MQGYYSDPTYRFHVGNMSEAATLQHEGVLLGSVVPGILAYRVKTANENFMMQVHYDAGTVLSLQLPAPRRWKYALSASATTKHIIVTDEWKNSLDVFTAAGNIPHFAADCCS